ncbi:MAG TPA: flavohemoglobin expression-modulating QEGLA motif protein [Allosphingosinicella sp.]|nr:flavohemoglobin expression-modulating QEGLA motif protein [Allosphingosinicella sp.]
MPRNGSASARDRSSPSVDLDRPGGYREVLPGGGRAHVDRPLPCLVLSRYPREDTHNLSRRVATTSAAYLTWPAGSDPDALEALGRIVEAQRGSFERVLLISLHDLERDRNLDQHEPRLERYEFVIAASDDAPAKAAAACLGKALSNLEVDLRRPRIRQGERLFLEPGLDEAVGPGDVSHVSVGLPQNYRLPVRDGIYPQLQHDLAVGIFDALLQAMWAFYREISPQAPLHHRSLGRSSFVTAAKTVDGKLDKVASSFDFLLSVSPINTAQALEQFRASGYQVEPEFRYRPLVVDPELEKRRLHTIDFRRVEDPVLETLFSEKQREVDLQLTMLQYRNSRNFRYSSLMLYGPVKAPLVESARDILEHVPSGGPAAAEDEAIDCKDIRDAAQRLIESYRKIYPQFRARVVLRDDLAAGMMVSGNKLLISTQTQMRRGRLDALLQHEISVHLLTYVNGDAQGLKIFRSGLAGYEGIQEGLAVFAECAVGGLTRARLRLLGARVVAVDAMVAGASFVDCFRLLRDQHGFTARGAFNITARIYRSGGLTKDAIYLRGFKKVISILAEGRELTPLWCGKIGAQHIPVIEELALRGLLRAPAVTPEFLARPDALANIAAMRSASSLSDLV